MAKDLMEDGSYFAMMVYKGHADGMVSGQPIRRNIRFYQHYNLLKQNQFICGFFDLFYVLRRPSFCFGDCAINPNPTAEQLAEIAISSADSSLAFGIEPK
jgi:phosphate acetyltransferase